MKQKAMMPIIYVAGPFRGPTAWAIAENVRAAEQVGYEVARLGACPLIPHANTANFHGTMTDQFWLDATMALLRKADAVVLMETWKSSKGATAENAEAHRLSIPVFLARESCSWRDHVRDWIAAWKANQKE